MISVTTRRAALLDRWASRHAMTRAALFAPLVLFALLAAWFLARRTEQVRQGIAAEGRTEAVALGQLVAGRLDAQYRELQFAGIALLGPRADPSHPTPDTARTLREFTALHPNLYALNIQDADGRSIAWSTQRQPARPIAAGSAFTPLPGQSDFLIGRSQFAARASLVAPSTSGARPQRSGHVLPMRVRVRGNGGRTRFFVGSPYRIEDLLATNALHGRPWLLTLVDRRDGQILGAVDAQGVRFPPRAAPVDGYIDVVVPVPGFPLEVRAEPSPGFVRAKTLAALAPLAALMGTMLLVLAASAGFAALLLERLGVRNRELGRTSTLLGRTGEIQDFLAQVNQSAAGIDDEAAFLHAVCDLAITKGRLALAIVARPGSDGSLTFPAAAGQMAYLDGLAISIRPDVPEGQGYGGRAWREDRAFFDVDFGSNPLAPWRTRAETLGMRAVAALPIRREGRPWALLLLYRGDDVAFDPVMQQLLLELATDVGRGLERIADRQRLRLLDQAVGALSEGLSIGGIDRKLIYVNSAFSAISGYAPEEVLGRNCLFLQGADTDPDTARRIREALASGQSFDGEILNVRKDGSRFWNSLHLDAVRDSRGQITHFVGIQRDVTEQRHALDLQNALLENTTSGILIAHGQRIVATNSTVTRMLGVEPQALLGQSMRRFYRDDPEFARVESAAGTLRSQKAVTVQSLRMQRSDGTALLCDLQGRMLPDGRTSVWTLSDMTEREAQAERLRRAQSVYRALAAVAESLLQGTTEAGMIVRLCQSLIDGTEFTAVWLARPGEDCVFRTLGRAGRKPQDEELLDSLQVTVHDADFAIAKAWRAQATVAHEDTLAEHETGSYAQLVRRLRGASVLAVPVRRAGLPWAGLVFIAHHALWFDDTTRGACEQVAALLGHGLDELDRKVALRTLQDTESRRARTDPLTGLPNRLALDEYLPGAIARAERRQTALAVGVLDLDEFKPVNDRFGHAVGDTLLQQFAEALHGRLRRTDFLARVGGDEFVVVSEDLDPDQMIYQLGVALDRLHTAVEAPFDLGDGRSAQVGMTMGLALYPQDAGEADTLLRLADAAMYASKVHKFDRTRWWRIGNAGIDRAEDDARETALDMFGTAASALLQALDAQILDAVAAAFAAAFYGELAKDPELARILDCVSSDELDRLKREQAGHLLFLLRPGTTRESLEDNARKLGRIHALVGLAGAGMERAFALYEDLLRGQLEDALISSRQRYRILRVATARLRLDVQTQLAAMDQIIDAYSSLLRTPTAAGARWIDVLPATLDALVGLPGVRHAVVLRPDEDGVLRIEAGTGTEFERLAEIIERDGLYPNLNPLPGVDRGPLSMAWFTREVQRVDAYQLDPRLRTWHALARDFGWRSAATLPIADRDQVDSVLMLFGAYPHQFASNWARSWLEFLHTRLDAMFAASSRNLHPASPDQTRLYRERLYGQGLRMWIQPIVDLRTGTVSKVEALARLHLADGTVAAPGQFLAAFGAQDLHALFRLGLRQALDLVHDWRKAGLEVDIAVNLPPSTLLHPDCPSWVEQALRRAQVAARHLTLEILESEELDEARSDEAIYALDALGVRLALDDLGSGYSSLKRLASLPIDTVKIDQALVRELPHDPVKTIRLLAALVRIGQDFARRTVVEGLEDDGFVEAAQRLGAHLGQGYGLARPMPADAFLAWLRSRGPTTEAHFDGPHTWAGALACQWVTMHDPRNLRDSGPRDACALAHFLRVQGIDDPDVLRWHEVAHGDAEPKAREAASDALLQWLAARVTAAAPR